jgi:hypothetical protein
VFHEIVIVRAESPVIDARTQRGAAADICGNRIENNPTRAIIRTMPTSVQA